MNKKTDISTQIKFLFSERTKTKQIAMEQISDSIAIAVSLLVNTFKIGSKILTCGNSDNIIKAIETAHSNKCRLLL